VEANSRILLHGRHQRRDILLENFQKTSEIGLTIHSVTSEMGAAMWRKFRIMAGKHRATKNFIINPSDGRKIYFLADGPHLVKNIKNCLVQNKIIQLSITKQSYEN
jgi:hypothetical protein